MTSKNFVDTFAEKMGRSKAETKEIVRMFEETLKEMVSEESIKVADLNFVVKDVPERDGVNPKTGEKMLIPASKRLYVKVSSGFKRFINPKE